VNWTSWLIWGFGATVVLTVLLSASQWLRVTRINLPYMLGTIVTRSRDRARLYGFAIHMVDGMAISLVYVGAFETLGWSTWWFGALIGAVHAAFVLLVAIPALPGIHPRMSSESTGPTVARELEPPGFLAMNYGIRTPISLVIAHIAYGAILGGFYKPLP
jgi:hypothetical protein